jgi:putative serine protease PepD
MAAGAPLGLRSTDTQGIVSALHRAVPLSREDSDTKTVIDVVQNHASINHGNSGGPLLNSSGEVVGVNSQIAGQTGANVGIGFAIPSSTVKSIADTLSSCGQVEHAYLGVSVQEIPSTLAGQLGAVGGVEITKVVSGTPAEKANLIGPTGQKTVDGLPYPTGGDVITAIDGHKVTTAEGVQQAIDAHHPGDSVSITYWRKGETKTVSVTLATRPAQIQQ